MDFRYEKLLTETTPYLGVAPLQRIPIALLSKYPDLVSDEELRDMVQDADIFDVSNGCVPSSMLIIVQLGMPNGHEKENMEGRFSAISAAHVDIAQ